VNEDPSFLPTTITRSDPRVVSILWDDGHETRFTAAQLRRLCPCARCVDEVTGKLLLDPVSVPDDLTQADVRLVGNYGLGIRFADGHETGIYAFRMLRENDPGP